MDSNAAARVEATVQPLAPQQLAATAPEQHLLDPLAEAEALYQQEAHLLKSQESTTSSKRRKLVRLSEQQK